MSSTLQIDDKEEALLQIQYRRTRMGKKAVPKQKRAPKWLYPTSIARNYGRTLEQYVLELEEVINNLLIVHLPGLAKERDELLPESARQTDSWDDSVDRVLDNLKLGMDKVPFDASFLAQNIGQRTSEWNDTQWRKTMRAVVGVEIFQREPWMPATMKTFEKENVALIKDVKDKVYRDIEGVVDRGMKAGDRWDSIAYDIVGDSKTFKALQVREQQFLDQGIKNVKGKSIVEKARNRAKNIARDQVGKLNGDLTKLRQTNIGIEEYWWRDSRDRRVRALHRKYANQSLAGKKFKWSKPPPDGHPGQAVLCRCTPEADFTPVLAGL